MRLDAHQHFWSYVPSEYPWMTAEKDKLRRDYLPPDLERELANAKLDGSIAVQARQTERESDWLLSLADHHPSIKGVVGWVDLQSDDVEGALARLSAHPKFSGVRHVVQDEPDDAFMLRPGFLRGLGRLKQFDLTYDLLLFPRQLPSAIQVVRRFPEQPFVLDHIAKPSIKTGALSPWDRDLRELAKHRNVWCKISGLITEAKWHAWMADEFRPYLDVVCEAFGEDRLMFGSDWPVCLLSGEYREVFNLANEYLLTFPVRARAKFLGENAAAFYGISA